MSKVKAIKTSFNGGEISKQCYGRVDLQNYSASNKTLKNALPTIYGSVVKRGGTEFVSEVNENCFLVEFSVNRFINFILEFGDHYIRFYKNKKPIMNEDNTIYEVYTDYSIDDLIENGRITLNYTQSVDVLYLCHRKYKTQTLKRYADNNWVLEDLSFKSGPFDNMNTDTTKQLTSTGKEGLITVDAVCNSANLTLVLPNGQTQTYHNLPHTIWELDGKEIYRANRFMSVDDAIVQLLGTSDGQNFNVTRNGNNINISVKDTSVINYSGKTLSFKRRKIIEKLSDEVYKTTKYECAAQFSSVSSADVFEDEDVGKLLRITYTDTNTVMWEAGKSGISIGAIRKSGNNYYKALTSGTTGTIKPIHTSGSVSDGNVVWLYLHSGYGIGTILEVVNSSQAKVNVDGYMPDFSTATSLWEKGLVGKGGVFPNACCFYKERFVFAISTSSGTKICASCAGDYNNFSDNDFGDILDENAITVILQGKYEASVEWLVAASKVMVGTTSEEFIFGEQTVAEVLSPTNVQCVSVSKLGSSKLRALEVLDEMFFVSKDEKQIASLNYIAEKDTFRPVDISVMFEHVFDSGVKSWCFANRPYKTIWFCNDDGKLISVSYDAENKVCACARHDVGGVVENVACVGNGSGNYSDVYMVVKRNINGVEKKYIEVLSWGLPLDKEKNNNKEQIFVDSAIVVKTDTETNIIDGLEHLEGCFVDVLVDGKIEQKLQVINSRVLIKNFGKTFVVGLPYEMVVETLYINIGGNSGTSQGLSQRVNKLMARCIDTRYIKASASGGNMFDDLVNSNELIDGDFEISLPSDYSKTMTITLKNDKPVACCILAIIADIGTYE